MAMNVRPVPTLDNEVNDIRLATAEIVNESILPVEHRLWGRITGEGRASSETAEDARTLSHEIQDRVKRANLWAPHLPEEFGGMGLSFMQHAYMNEVWGANSYSRLRFRGNRYACEVSSGLATMYRHCAIFLFYSSCRARKCHPAVTLTLARC